MSGEIRLKIILIGDANVGKTSILFNYTGHHFSESYKSTIGVEYKEKKLKVNKHKVVLDIWDTSGQERFHSITKNYFRNANGILFVYDISDQKSFDSIKNWIIDSEKFDTECQKILVGNKCDLEENRVVTKDEMENFARLKKMESIEVSVKKNININLAFNSLIGLIIGNKTDEELMDKFYGEIPSFSLNSHTHRKIRKKKSCCL